jgi:hypothetical protein
MTLHLNAFFSHAPLRLGVLLVARFRHTPLRFLVWVFLLIVSLSGK